MELALALIEERRKEFSSNFKNKKSKKIKIKTKSYEYRANSNYSLCLQRRSRYYGIKHLIKYKVNI